MDLVLYLAGNSLFKHSLLGYVPWSRPIGILALALLIPFAVAVNRLVLSAGATLVVATLAAATGTPRRSGAHAAAETSS